ncbi:fungal pheromone mating factor STE2 GPCR domain-containing protein [Hirsutella rhossiliensis]|uniref:Fungal pheromone mating factor STE2 GPCR domain-containing protein n=1 Tax=Hirsutella rhossiliensis TaxID=111463 RepID=A0A9P8NA72_9HYPO|nr:fungal pheromone mating factor STE2 GPCR domain-containing protein [Hirsutella rhossiliensis]KAH0967437.1 fungal pheromone mating factor STE2 GPCR domain-containing protein [Hirsutella rhossiliensis]
MDSISPQPPSSVLDSHPPPVPAGAPFNPLDQLVTFYGPDGRSVLGVPMAAVDAVNQESVSMSVNYGAQLGAALVMLLAVLALTPAAKLRRPSALLHLTGLVVCLVRTGFLVAPPLSPVGYFYVFWAGDFSTVPQTYLYALVAGNVVSFLFVVVVELALMNQAWTMVSLWPDAARYSLAAASAVVTLTTIGFRFALTVMSCKAAVGLSFPMAFFWLMQASLVTNAASIFWFCALFNSKLLLHLVSNRGMLPSAGTLSSMEVLVMTNGVLMIVPVIFAGLEWGHFQNFEAASLTPTSVAIILPLGTLAAQRMTTRPNTAGNGANNLARLPPSGSSGAAAHPSSGNHCSATPKDSSLSTSWNSEGSGNHSSSVPSKCLCERGPAPGQATSASARRGGTVVDHFDLELRQIDSTSALAGDMTEHCLVQHDKRI